jgi:hypothetical protein
MRLALINNQGEIVDTIENIDDMDLSKAFAQADVIEDIERMIRLAKSQEVEA